MAAIIEILDIESRNTDRIHLWREGLFLRAYQRSAFLFHTRVKPFNPVKKFYKNAGCDVVLLGFPSDRLGSIFPGREAESMSDGHAVFVSEGTCDEQAYSEWFDAVKVVPPKESRRQGALPCTAASAPVIPGPDQGGSAGSVGGTRRRYNILRELENFSIQSATPIECMLFLNRLQSELKSCTDGDL
ncbi:MAG: hypothetical protein FWE10_03810 [Rikenellaceae bacterium]|nr:hypothetical protein [Rikenellaceae bacterium]MCL2693436.1 hypothetical protein [Rikenellaceae bacterium]